MFLVQRVGPTSFVVREDGRRRACKVLIGAKMTCGCGGGFGGSNTNRRVGSNSARAGSGLSATTSATRLAIMEAAGIRTDADDAATVHATRDLPEVCAHIVFVMRKVLGVPRSNPLTWQVSLIDRELDEVLRCEPRAVAFAVDAGRRRGERSTDASGGAVLTARTQSAPHLTDSFRSRKQLTHVHIARRTSLQARVPCPL